MGIGALLGGIQGWAEVTLRNPDGSVADHRVVTNVHTNSGRRMLASTKYLGAYIGISDDEHPSGLKDGVNIFRTDLQSPVPYATPVVTWDAISRTITYTTSFTAPSAPPRTVRILTFGYATSTQGTHPSAATYMVLSPPVSQGAAQVLEVVYRQQFTFPAKSMRRWETSTLANMRRWADAVGNGWFFVGGLFAQYSPFLSWGRYGFTDGEARYAGIPFGGDGGWLQAESPGPNVDGSSDPRLCARGAGTLVSFDLNVANNSLKVGSIGAAHGLHTSAWDALGGTAGATNMFPAMGWQALTTAEGIVSTVFAHPSGEDYLFNVVGSAALGAGAVQVRGPFRPDQVLPRSYAYRVTITASGDTDGGTEGKYVLTRGPHTTNGTITSDHSFGLPLKYLHRTTDVAQQDWVTQNKTSLVWDGRGRYWATGHNNTDRSALLCWKAGTCEEILADVSQDDTRFYGLARSTELIPTINQSYQRYAPPGLASDEAGRVFLPSRDPTAGTQAVYIIDNRKPGREYQRPSGTAVGGNTTFTVSAQDEIHGMFPFVPGDVGAQIRIVSGPNAGIRTISTYNSATSVDFSGGNLTADSAMTWHWVLVTKRTSATGLADKQRHLLYDQPNGRLWSFADGGLQVSTDLGATWSTQINQTNGLSTADAVVARVPDGENAPRTAAIGNSGEVFWVDTLGGVNRYVGTGPGGTHTRIAPGDFTGTITSFGVFGIVFDPLAPQLGAGTQGALWITQADDGTGAVTFWRADLNLAFTGANLVAYSNPTVVGYAGALNRGPTHVVVVPGGQAYMANKQDQIWARWDPATDTFTNVTVFQNHGSYFLSWGAWDVRPDGTSVHMTYNSAEQNLFGFPVPYRWDSTSSQWRPWSGTGAQFNSRYSLANNGEKLLHSGYAGLLDNIQVRFVQNGSVPPTSEYISGESYTFLGSFGVHRTNIQDLAWGYDSSWADPRIILEDETVRAVAGRGSLQVFWQADNTPVATQEAAALGAGIPSLDQSGRNYGWMPRRFSGLYNNPANGPVPDTQMLSGHRAVTMGLDLGSAQVVAKIRVHGLFNSLPYFFGNIAAPNTIYRFRLYHSDDNSTWTEVTASRFVAGEITAPVNPDAACQHVDIELNDAGGGSPTDFQSPWLGLTFDLVRAGLSSGARTHRYWKVIFTSYHAETQLLDNGLSNTVFGSIHAIDGSGNAIGVASSLRLPEVSDPNFLASQVLEASWIQDKVGVGGKGGVNSAPDAFADGYTDQVTIASGTFNTAAINPATDLLAYRHPSTGTFLRPEGASPGSPGARGEQTAVRITAVTTSTITVALRNIPDNLSAVDWEVRRPLIPTDQFPDPGEIAYDPAAGYLSFHDTDVAGGKDFKITRRSVIMRS